MSLLSIVLTIAFLVLLFFIIKYLLFDPYTLQNIQNGQTPSTIKATSLATNGSDVPSSNFAYSMWFYINDWNYRYGEPKVVLGRMGAKSIPGGGSLDGVTGLDPCPAVILGATENDVTIALGCYPGANQEPTTAGSNTILHTCGVSNVPIQKWVNLLITTYGRTLDVYIDGKLVRTCLLPGVASINNNADIYVTPNGGFNGWTSKIQYYPNSLNPQDAWNIYLQGYGSWLTSMNTYEVQLSLLENGTKKAEISI